MADHVDPPGCGPSVDHRHLRRHADDRLHRQHCFSPRARARHRHRGRRCHRRGREYRAGDGGASGAAGAGCLQARHGGDHRPDSRHHPGSVVGVRACRLHPWHQRAALPAVRGRRLGLDADLRGQRADAQPGALRSAPQARPAHQRPDALRPGCHRPCPRRLRGRGASPGARLARRGRGCRRHAGGLGVAVQQDAAELFAGRGPGRDLRGPASSRRRIAQPHRGRGQAGRGHRQADSGRRRRTVGGRTELHRLCPIGQPGFLRHPPQVIRRAHRSRAKCERDHRATAAADGRHPGCRRISVQPAAGARPGQHRWLPICAGGPAGPITVRCRSRAARAGRRGQRAARARGRVQHLCRRHAADLSRHRSRQGAGARRQDQRHLQRLAVDARQLLRQRLQRVRPHLAGQHPGRDIVSRPPRRHLPDLRAQRAGRDGSDPGLGRGQARARTADDRTLQRLPGRDRERCGEARLQLRASSGCHGARLRHHVAGGLRLRMDGDGVAGEGGGWTHRHRAGSCRAVRVPVPGRALRKLEHPNSRLALR